MRGATAIMWLPPTLGACLCLICLKHLILGDKQDANLKKRKFTFLSNTNAGKTKLWLKVNSFQEHLKFRYPESWPSSYQFAFLHEWSKCLTVKKWREQNLNFQFCLKVSLRQVLVGWLVGGQHFAEMKLTESWAMNKSGNQDLSPHTPALMKGSKFV